ncbi:MAG: hypothetical protein Q8K02_10320, partial [Flavobacterium sp.]|nr:hypothetical protein [Flavobacterium sp.]
KILLVTASFYPGNSPRALRATELAKEFSRLGHKVSVLTPVKSDSLISFAQKHRIELINLGSKDWKDIPTNGSFSMIKRAIRRILLMLFEYPQIQYLFVVKSKLKNLVGYDLMISNAVPYPVHWGVAFARTKKHPIAKTWVADCGDPYMLLRYDNFPKLFYFKYLEKYFSRKADWITIPRISMLPNYYPEFHPKIKAIPQGFNFEETPIENYIPNEVPTFAFAGTFLHKVRNPFDLLNTLSKWQKPFKFVVYTQDTSLLDDFQDILKEKLEIRKPIPRTELIAELSKMDFLVNIGYDPVNQMPSKLIDYYITKRPIFNYNMEDFDPLKVQEFLSGNYQTALLMPSVDEYDIRKVAKRFLDLQNETI